MMVLLYMSLRGTCSFLLSCVRICKEYYSPTDRYVEETAAIAASLQQETVAAFARQRLMGPVSAWVLNVLSTW